MTFSMRMQPDNVASSIFTQCDVSYKAIIGMYMVVLIKKKYLFFFSSSAHFLIFVQPSICRTVCMHALVCLLSYELQSTVECMRVFFSPVINCSCIENTRITIRIVSHSIY